MNRSPLRWLLGAAVVALPLAAVLALGSWRDEGRASAATPRVVPSEGDSIRIELADGIVLELQEPPRRVVPANAGAVDFVSQIVGPERVAALPESAFPFSRLDPAAAGWAALPRFEGYHAETMIALDADLVVTHGWQSPETTAILGENGIPVLVCPLPSRWSDVARTLSVVASALGEAERGARVLAELEARVEAMRASARARPRLSAVSYSNLGTGGWVAGAGTTTDILFELVGLRNAAGEAGIEGHREIDHEGLLALAPDVLVVGEADADEGISSTLAYLHGQEALAGLPALRADLVLSLPHELFASSSTELVRGAERLAEELERKLARR